MVKFSWYFLIQLIRKKNYIIEYHESNDHELAGGPKWHDTILLNVKCFVKWYDKYGLNWHAKHDLHLQKLFSC